MRGGGRKSADRFDGRSENAPIAREKPHAETDIDREWLDGTVVCGGTEEPDAPELREMVAAAHH
jgi:hypothetical protein